MTELETFNAQVASSRKAVLDSIPELKSQASSSRKGSIKGDSSSSRKPSAASVKEAVPTKGEEENVAILQVRSKKTKKVIAPIPVSESDDSAVSKSKRASPSKVKPDTQKKKVKPTPL